MIHQTREQMIRRPSDDNVFSTPVAFIVFNRPEVTERVFAAIQAARPARLLVIADGVRHGRPGEAERCEQVRQIVQNVTWPCRLETNFAAENMGCRDRVISGLNWVFGLVEEAIILEDDCLPDPSFFPYCGELLSRFRGDSRIGMIAGTNFVERFFHGPESYYFSQIPHIWGWATWRTAWASYDPSLGSWPRLKASNLLSEIVGNPRVVHQLSRIFDQMHEGAGPNTWDYQWLYSNLINHWLSIVPKRNLITNIGFGPDATHTVEPNSNHSLPSGRLEFPLSHPQAVVPLRSMDRIDMKISFPGTARSRISYKLRRLGQYFVDSVRSAQYRRQ